LWASWNVRDDGTSQQAPATVYWPITDADVFLGGPAFALRSLRVGTQSLIDEVQKVVWSVDPDLPLNEVRAELLLLQVDGSPIERKHLNESWR